MKTKEPSFPLCVLFLLAFLGLASAQSANVEISWDNPGPMSGTNLTWPIYWTTNLTLPTNQWPLLCIVTTPSNASPTRLAFTTNLTYNTYFFAMQWTNAFWRTSSFFSAAVATPVLPPINQPFNLGLRSL